MRLHGNVNAVMLAGSGEATDCVFEHSKHLYPKGNVVNMNMVTQQAFCLYEYAFLGVKKKNTNTSNH